MTAAARAKVTRKLVLGIGSLPARWAGGIGDDVGKGSEVGGESRRLLLAELAPKLVSRGEHPQVRPNWARARPQPQRPAGRGAKATRRSAYTSVVAVAPNRRGRRTVDQFSSTTVTSSQIHTTAQASHDAIHQIMTADPCTGGLWPGGFGEAFGGDVTGARTRHGRGDKALRRPEGTVRTKVGRN